VPQNGKFWLNIDFAHARKISPGENCLARFPTRQNLPRPGKLCRVAGQILPLFRKDAGEKTSKTKEKIGSRRHRATLTSVTGRGPPRKQKGRCMRIAEHEGMSRTAQEKRAAHTRRPR